MQESSYVFFTLLEESFSVEADIRMADIAVATVPHLSPEDSQNVINSFKNRTDDILDLTDMENQSSTEEIKKAFNQM